MPTVTLAPVSAGARTASEASTLRASAVLTSSYVVSTNDVNVVAWETVTLGFDYNDGDETSVQVYVEGYDGTTWREITVRDTPTLGVSEVTTLILQLSPGNFATSVNIAAPPIDVRGFQRIRTYQKATGGTPTGTLGVTVTGGIGISARGA